MVCPGFERLVDGFSLPQAAVSQIVNYIRGCRAIAAEYMMLL